MNRGAWLQTEKITECYRNISELFVIGVASVITEDTSCRLCQA